jgi:iron complex transport system permease protein
VTAALAERSPLPGRVLRTRRVSIRIDMRTVRVSAVLAASIFAVGCWSISTGDFPVAITDVVATLFGGGSDDAEFVVEQLRMPRVITGVMVGAAFAVSGAIFQSLANNPLASPDVVGFNAGAAMGAVFMIVATNGTALQVSIGALAGGFGTALLVYLLAYKGGVQGYRLILVGIGIGYAAMAVNDYLITRAQIFEVQRAAVWLTGSLNGRTWDNVRPVAAGLLVLLPVTVLLGRKLRLLELGPEAAAALGVRVGRTRLTLVLCGLGLSALATASAGPVAFVSLIAPPIARRLVRAPGASLIPAALVGALLTTVADLAARRMFAPTELPVGIATAAIGGPYLLWLLTREIRSGSM